MKVKEFIRFVKENCRKDEQIIISAPSYYESDYYIARIKNLRFPVCFCEEEEVKNESKRIYKISSKALLGR